MAHQISSHILPEDPQFHPTSTPLLNTITMGFLTKLFHIHSTLQALLAETSKSKKYSVLENPESQSPISQYLP
jgi:hypothetical protein